jgi:molybdate transport system regulatory protein
MARLTIRIDLDQEAAFGPGKARLLEKLDEMGSIRRAAAAMDMSYRRAWLLVQDIETTMGAPVIRAKTGGVGGGGVTLTELGRTVLRQYRVIERKATRSVGDELRTLTKLRSGATKASRIRTSAKRRRLRKR